MLARQSEMAFRVRLAAFTTFGLALLIFADLATSQENAKKQDSGRQKAARQEVEDDADYGLPKRMVRQLKSKVIPALKSGDQASFVESMESIIRRADESQFDAIERIGMDQEIPSLNRAFGRAVMRTVEQGNAPNFSRMQFAALMYLNRYIAEHIDRELATIGRHDVMQANLQLRDSWRENEKLFWDVHVFDNVINNLNTLAQFAIGINEKHFARAQKRSDQETLEKLQVINGIPGKIATTRWQMQQHEMVLRIKELEFAEQILRESKDFEQRLNAAFAFQMDAGHLSEFFTSVDSNRLTVEELKQSDLPQRLQQLVLSGRQSGENVLTKAIQLRSGAHWWLRGRYGKGPLAAGLLKAPNATRNEQLMFGLYMPASRPRPINSVSYENEVYPGFDRRHFYTWAVEYRELIANYSRDEQSTQTFGPKNSSYAGHFW